ncbi:MAG: UDP-GlcNAc:undecaprenyl-phosphate/decaprenyl-phosphate GlcNAc-phosphate transferase [Solirubrobacterales bacterium]|jgi:UDP-GlcNAc:undecaprenyl-phosphate GlcNAc-1-phosphate transferase|nr:UDP-GlcNAc:undecaprenyl-phosphate/decaprenyl-phosphate GlcNAc-phosphate transferase [Solirubrobacterales bacterium]
MEQTPNSLDALFAFLLAGLLTMLLVPLTSRLANRVGAIDFPNQRSLHDIPTPKLGGLAILAGVLAAGVIWLPSEGESRAILIGAVVITLVGFVDDVYDLSALPKLLGQAAAVVIPVAAGVTVESFTIPFFGRLTPGTVELVNLPWVDAVNLGQVATVVGIVAVINVINLIDGVDGLAAGVCVISALSLAVIALSLERTDAGVLAALTAGAALGFLRHGFPPANVFMGDTGSNLLGYLLGAVAVQGALKTNAVVALFLPLIILAVPILDTGFVVAKRLKYRRPIYKADTSHFHHRMANIGFSQRRTLLYLYGWTLVMAALALALRFVPYSDNHGHFNPFWTAVMLVCGVLALAASVYLVSVLEILKLRQVRLRQLVTIRSKVGRPVPAAQEVDRAVEEELETGTFPAVDPETGEFGAVEPETPSGRR